MRDGLKIPILFVVMMIVGMRDDLIKSDLEGSLLINDNINEQFPTQKYRKIIFVNLPYHT